MSGKKSGKLKKPNFLVPLFRVITHLQESDPGAYAWIFGEAAALHRTRMPGLARQAGGDNVIPIGRRQEGESGLDTRKLWSENCLDFRQAVIAYLQEHNARPAIDKKLLKKAGIRDAWDNPPKP